MEINLSQTQTQVLKTLIQQGRYSSVEDALDMALLLLLEETAPQTFGDRPDYIAWADETRRKIETAREQVERGEVFDVEDVLDRLRDKVQKAREMQA